MKTITPCLWFNGQGEDAAKFYTSIFKNSKITHTQRYGEAGQEHHRQPVGSVMVVAFEINGQPFTALNGGPQFKFTEAVSLMVRCKDQQEIDHYWKKLSAGGPPEAQICGWLKDKYGLSWQVVPAMLTDMMRDAKGYDRMMVALMGMKKLVIAELEKAFKGK